MIRSACLNLARLRRPGVFPFLAVTAALWWLGSTSIGLKAQTFDATDLREPTDLATTVWLVHGGDDPAYASPNFDDSGWTLFDATKSLKTVFPNRRPEIVWYRLLHSSYSRSFFG